MSQSAGSVSSNADSRNSPPQGGSQGIHGRLLVWSCVVWVCAFAYAIVRYVYFGPVSASEIPLFIANKATSFAAVLLFALSLILSRLGRVEAARAMGVVGTRLVPVHIGMSLVLLAMDRIPSLHVGDGSLRPTAVLALAVGALGASALFWQKWKPTHRHVGIVRRGVVALSFLHVCFWGAERWPATSDWHGSMPPITLLAAAAGSAGLIIGYRRRE